MILSEKNLELFAAKCYINNNCIDIDEFKEDFNRLKYIKRLVKRYEVYGELRERLILNHLVIMYNTFENKYTSPEQRKQQRTRRHQPPPKPTRPGSHTPCGAAPPSL